MSNEHAPCSLVIQTDRRINDLETDTERNSDKAEYALTDMRKSFESFQRWLIGIIVMSVLLSVTGGLWKITDEFKEVREAIHDLDTKITNINRVQ